VLQGDHIVTQKQLYGGTQLLFQSVCPRRHRRHVRRRHRARRVERAVRRARRRAFAETPPTCLSLVDLDELAAIKGPMKVVDSTFATPLAQRPIDHGIDLVLHSATKAIAGHNDATLGVVAGSRELVAWLWGFAVLQGANASPYDALNGLRGIRTLGVRLRQQTETATRLAEMLETHPAVTGVCYPGLASFAQRELAERQLQLSGGLLAFDLAGGLDAGRRFVESVRIAQFASSLGGPETLVTHPASTTHVGLLPEELAEAEISPGTVRVSAGLEHTDDVLADFRQALAAIDA
jgi:cystathionine beta-lyase/cystathionine gamma-synthase